MLSSFDSHSVEMYVLPLAKFVVVAKATWFATSRLTIVWSPKRYKDVLVFIDVVVLF